ncbi:hypothetical protein Hdeb2414_s0013g00412481 [Helianthus debilis subsp. tardiflorus]
MRKQFLSVLFVNSEEDDDDNLLYNTKQITIQTTFQLSGFGMCFIIISFNFKC